jgi:hypothetical protein
MLLFTLAPQKHGLFQQVLHQLITCVSQVAVRVVEVILVVAAVQVVS